MPVITIEMGKLSLDQKKQMIEKFTEVAFEITHIRKESFIVLIKESEDDNIGVGGESLTDLKKKLSS